MKKDVQLNALLCQAVTAEEIDFPLVEKLLKAGADPIGRCSEEDEDENAFGEALVNAQGNGNDYYSVDLKWAAQLPKLTQLFLEHGMDIEKCEWDLLHYLTWLRHEYGIETLKLLLEHNLSPDYADYFVEDLIGDMLQFEPLDMNNAYWVGSVIWALKMVMLTAAFNKDRLEECVCIRHLIEPENNPETDLGMFIEWNNFIYGIEIPFDKKDEDGLDGCRINITNTDSAARVWSFRMKGFL